MKQLIGSVSSLILISSFFLLLSQNQFNAICYLSYLCPDSADSNFTLSSPFVSNLKSLKLRKIYSEKNFSGFANASEGNDPAKAFGLYLCKDGISPSNCQTCFEQAEHNITQLCPEKKEVIVWYEECLLRYSDRSFFSIMETFPRMCMRVNQPATDPNFNETLKALFQNLMGKANTSKYATGKVDLVDSMKLYGIVQCTPDLSPVDCQKCLINATSKIPYCSGGMIYGRILLPSCNARYQLSTYDDGDTSPRPPQLPPAPSPTAKRSTFDDGDTSPGPPQLPPAPSPTAKRKWIEVLSLSAGLGILIGFIALIIWRRKNAREDKESSQEVKLDLQRANVRNDIRKEHLEGENVQISNEFPSMQLDVINAATNSFCDSNKLGKGGFGLVYKGTLADGKEIAVKRLSISSGQGLNEFKNEVMLIARLQHRNLVKLLGCCLENNETLLVYEYMMNRSLDMFLFDAKMSVQLDWHRRFNIIKGIARGIMYLHEDSRLRVVHRDLKASNILLDSEMNPKISDFGMARIFSGNQSEASTKRIVGTYGYMSPEYAMGGLFSSKSDVFSFGVLLLEIISGKRNNNFYIHEHCESLLIFAWKLWSKGQGMQLIDPILVQSCVASEVLKCIHIGLLCVQKDPVDRPTMSYVILMLGSESIALSNPTEPTFFVGRVVEEPVQTPIDDNMNCSVNQITLTEIFPR